MTKEDWDVKSDGDDNQVSMWSFEIKITARLD